jgi:uncharacterized protein with FMN-binding domain
MKKYFVSFVFIVLFGGYTAFQYLNSTNVSYATTANNQTQIQVPTQTPAVAVTNTATAQSVQSQSTQTQIQTSQIPAQTTPTPVQTPVAKPQGQFVDGTYTGSVANAYYGNVQVQAVISGGKLANVSFLQYPNDRSTSRFINQQAMPMLISEAIQAQSANVNGVSGASDTSGAFQESLASALAQAKS